MGWTKNYQDLSSIYIKEFESRSSEGAKTAVEISKYIKQEFKNVKRIVDIPCGVGRISIPLSLQGYDVLGIDFSTQFIQFANKKKKEFKSDSVSFMVNDMYKSDNLISDFDPQVIISWWTSIGYKKRKNDEKLFRNIRSAVKPGTIFIIETWFREYILNFPIRHFWSDLGDVIVIIDQNINPLKDSVTSVHKYYQKGEGVLNLVGSFTSEIMLYSIIELKNLIENTGWEFLSLMNSISNINSFDIKQDRAVFVFRSK